MITIVAWMDWTTPRCCTWTVGDAPEDVKGAVDFASRQPFGRVYVLSGTADVFDRAYRPCEGMTFGQAIARV